MVKGVKELTKKILVIFLVVFFFAIGFISLTTINHLQGNARVINYTGIVRGATQRLIKQELNHTPNDELIQKLDEIITELAEGHGNNHLIILPDKKYQDLLKQLRNDWSEIKKEIIRYRGGADSQHLYDLSEKYFELADITVSAAEEYSEKSVSSAIRLLLCLNLIFILSASLFFLYSRKQKKVQAALERAENVNRVKSEFFSSMSHEIRTPMNGIIGMTAIAKMSVDDKDKLNDCLNKIELSAGYLMSLLNDVLDMSRIESGKVELCCETFELAHMAERLRAIFQQKADDAGIQFKVVSHDISISRVTGDELRITQILINIISNALKFTPSGGKVILDIRQTDLCSQKVSLEFIIKDTGIGMSEEFQKKIFQPFEQADACTTRKYGGTGLGMAISYNYIKLMQGDITLDSKPGEGSCFTVKLTLGLPDENVISRQSTDTLPSDSQLPASTNLTDVCVLLAEDNDLNAEISMTFLEHNGIRTDLAKNGKEALEKFSSSRDHEYTLILMDIQMPEMDGLQATRSIRSLNRQDASSVPIIGLSANAFTDDIAKARKSGMNGYLSKPVDMTKLFQMLRQYL